MKISFIKLGINGEGIGYLNKKPVFCNSVLPGETAEVEIVEDFGTYARAELVEITHEAPYRVDPLCRYSDKCGGCTLQKISYDEQLTMKRKLLEEALWKYGHVSYKLIRNMHGAREATGYRTSCKLPVKEEHGQLVTGMYKPRTNHFITVNYCPMHTQELENLRRDVMRIVNDFHLKEYDRGHGLRYLVLRSIDGHHQCTLVTGKEDLPKGLISKLSNIPGMESVCQSINTERKTPNVFGTHTKVLAGSEGMTITMKERNLKLQLSAESFFQLNVSQANELYKMAVSKIDPCDTVVEAYCGVGAMTLLARDTAKHVIGIESVKDAIINAKANAELNHVPNVKFICDDAAKGLQKVMREYNVDTLLADPPRSGMDDEMIKTILDSNIHKVIYISCNPATLGKNIKELKKHYDVRTVIPYDMFPNTPHIEAICVLERRGGE